MAFWSLFVLLELLCIFSVNSFIYIDYLVNISELKIGKVMDDRKAKPLDMENKGGK